MIQSQVRRHGNTGIRPDTGRAAEPESVAGFGRRCGYLL
jgi:hypothetical protein